VQVLVAILALPTLLWAMAGVVLGALDHHCEGRPRPCLVLGYDVRNLVYTLLMQTLRIPFELVPLLIQMAVTWWMLLPVVVLLLGLRRA